MELKKIKSIITLTAVCFILLSIVSSIDYQDCSVYGNCKKPTVTTAPINLSVGNVNSSTYWGSYIYSDYNMPTILSYSYNQTLAGDNRFLKLLGDNFGFSSNWLSYSNPNFAFNDTKLNETLDSILLGQTWFFVEDNLVDGTAEGTLSLTQQSDDYDSISYNLTESPSAGLTYYANTSADVTTDVNQICIRYRAIGDSFAVSLWSISSDNWEGYKTLSEDTIFNWVCAEIRDSTDHLVNNKIMMRIIHTGTSSLQHQLLIDAMYVSSGYIPRVGNEIDSLSIHKDGSTELTGNWNYGSYDINGSGDIATTETVNAKRVNLFKPATDLTISGDKQLKVIYEKEHTNTETRVTGSYSLLNMTGAGRPSREQFAGSFNILSSALLNNSGLLNYIFAVEGKVVSTNTFTTKPVGGKSTSGLNFEIYDNDNHNVSWGETTLQTNNIRVIQTSTPTFNKAGGSWLPEVTGVLASVAYSPTLVSGDSLTPSIYGGQFSAQGNTGANISTTTYGIKSIATGGNTNWALYNELGETYLAGNNYKVYFGTPQSTYIMSDGTDLWFNISTGVMRVINATGYADVHGATFVGHTDIYDKEKGDAIDWIKGVDDYAPEGVFNISSRYGYCPRPVTDFSNCTTIINEIVKHKYIIKDAGGEISITQEERIYPELSIGQTKHILETNSTGGILLESWITYKGEDNFQYETQECGTKMEDGLCLGKEITVLMENANDYKQAGVPLKLGEEIAFDVTTLVAKNIYTQSKVPDPAINYCKMIQDADIYNKANHYAYKLAGDRYVLDGEYRWVVLEGCEKQKLNEMCVESNNKYSWCPGYSPPNN